MRWEELRRGDMLVERNDLGGRVSIGPHLVLDTSDGILRLFDMHNYRMLPRFFISKLGRSPSPEHDDLHWAGWIVVRRDEP